MNIVFPMAGLGTRFSASGYNLPKPLIDVAGKPMYRHAVDCMPLNMASQLVFILKNNEFYNHLSNDIQNCYAQSYPCHIIALDHDTGGQAETVLESTTRLDLTIPTLIHNCDTSFSPLDSWHLIDDKTEGALVLFPSSEKRWSYARLNEEKTKVIEVREKEVISCHASTGTYYFKDTLKLLENIKTIIRKNLRENNEYYLSSVYTIMLDNCENIIPLWTDELMCFGTPPDLTDSLNRMIAYSQLKQQNIKL